MSKADIPYSISDVAIIYQVDMETVLKWIQKNELSAIVIDGRCYVTEDALKEFDSSRIASESTTE